MLYASVMVGFLYVQNIFEVPVFLYIACWSKVVYHYGIKVYFLIRNTGKGLSSFIRYIGTGWSSFVWHTIGSQLSELLGQIFH